MTQRLDPFVDGEHYHIFNKTVGNEPVFSEESWRSHFLRLLEYNLSFIPGVRYSYFSKLSDQQKSKIMTQRKARIHHQVIVFAYALMPNHFHLLLQQKTPKGISTIIQKTLSSFCKSYNQAHKRIGPLFLPNFRSKRIQSTSQLLQTARYIHLNPYASNLIDFEEIFESHLTSAPEYLAFKQSHSIFSIINSKHNLKVFGLSPRTFQTFVLADTSR